jgi:hypothetical protein
MLDNTQKASYMYAYIHLYVHTCIYIYIYIYIYKYLLFASNRTHSFQAHSTCAHVGQYTKGLLRSYVCVCICMRSLCMCVSICLATHRRLAETVFMRVYVYACMDTFEYTQKAYWDCMHVYVCIYAFMCIFWQQACWDYVHTHIYTGNMCIYICMHVIYTYIYVYASVCMQCASIWYTYICMYVLYIYIYICTHAYSHMLYACSFMCVYTPKYTPETQVLHISMRAYIQALLTNVIW